MINSQIAAGANIRDSVIVDTAIHDGASVVRRGVLVGGKHGKVEMPEGGAALEATRQLVAAGRLARDAEVVVFNTGSGASYRW